MFSLDFRQKSLSTWQVVHMECENIPKFANHGRERSSDWSNAGERSQAGETHNLAPFDDFMRRLELVIIGRSKGATKALVDAL